MMRILINKMFLSFPGIFHASELGWGDRPEICQKYNWNFVIADYPDEGFSMEQFITDVVSFLDKKDYTEIIICGLSFGEIVCREFMIHCPKDIKKNIVHHISLCGISIVEQLSKAKQVSVMIPSQITHKLLRKALKSRLSFAIYIENHGIFGLGKQFFGRHNYMKHPGLSKQRAQNIIISGTKGFNPGIYERGCIVAETKAIRPIDVDTTAIYALDDPFFTDPRLAAATILSRCTKSKRAVEINPGGHASLDTFPETYNLILESIFESIESKKS